MKTSEVSMPTADELNQLLRRDIIKVHFTKKNGELRIMKCTLLPEFLPARDQSETVTSSRKPPTGAISVWDLENQAWRSFRVESVNRVDIDENQ